MQEGQSHAYPSAETLPTRDEDPRAPLSRWTFSRRLAVVYGLVSLVILAGAGAFTWWQAEAIASRNEELAIAETRRLADRVGKALDEARQGIAVLAALDPMSRPPEDCEARLNAAHLTMNAMVRVLAIVDPGRRVACSTLPTLLGKTIEGGSVRTAALTGQPVRGAIAHSLADGRPVIGVAYPIRHGHRHDHVAIASITVEGLRETIGYHLPPQDGLRVWLLDSADGDVSLVGPTDGRPPPLPDALRISFMAPLPMDAGIAAQDGHFLVLARASEELTLLASFPGRSVRAGAPLEVALPPLLLALVLLGGLGALFWSVQRFIVGPLEAATRRLETPGGIARAETGGREGSAEVSALIRRLGASQSTREEAIRLRDLLLQEAHHRIKNHLALVASFLRLQERHLSDLAALRALRAAQGRILAIGATYEMLHGGTGQNVALDTLLDRFARALPSRNMTEGAAEVATDLAHVEVPADIAVKVGLVVNEIATNALKHAFTSRSPGRILITLRPDGDGFLLRVSDDGNGMAGTPRRGLGLTVVDSLLRGIGASIEREPGPGTGFAIAWHPTAPGSAPAPPPPSPGAAGMTA